MAVTNSRDALSDALTSITRKHRIKKLADQITEATPTLMKLKKESVSGGTDIRIPLEYAYITGAKWYAGDEALNTSANEKRIEAIYHVKQLDTPIVITEADRIKNSGPEKLLDLLDAEMKSAKNTAVDKFATGVFSAGTDSSSIVGLRVFGSASNSPGGLSQSTNSWWAAQVDSTTTNLTLGTMQELYESVTEGNDQPNLIVTYPGAFNRYWSLLQPQQRFQNDQTAKAGFRSLMFNAAEVVVDAYCPSNYLFMINLSKIYFKSYADRPFPGKMDPFQKPTNQDVRIAHNFWMGAFVSEENRKLGVMSALTD